MIRHPCEDPIGQSISNYFHLGDNSPVKVISSMVEDEELPPDYFFRKHNDMPLLERIALKRSSGSILDVGAGAGCHSLYLQEKKKHVTALEVSTLCCNVMQKRGIHHVINEDIFDIKIKSFDTILLLMNGIGIAGNLSRLPDLLHCLKKILAPGGSILLDSSDLIYLYEQENGSYSIDINADHYYGEIDYQLEYRSMKSPPFSWLFVDHVLLKDIAETCGLRFRIVEYGPHYDYLAELK
ncbi:MAG TPA: class I SAM-dependent methyltransferase [Prolixibacteraceae bacterium]|nr:class I SAM-dependent methyltransferase [Prolixibacteraceae bacterium]